MEGKTALAYYDLHIKAVVIDTHNDILTQAIENNYPFDEDLSGKTHSDLIRFKEGGLNAQFFAVWCDGKKEFPFEFALSQIDILDSICKRNPEKIKLVSNSLELKSCVSEGKIAALIGIEGGHMIENDLNNLDVFYHRGARYITLTWNNSNSWASSCADERELNGIEQKGLTGFGKNVIRKMNELGMMIDVSHVDEPTFWDVIETSNKPIIATHSNSYTLCPNPRNLKDEQIKAIAENGGTIQVNYYSGFLDKDYMNAKDAFLLRHQIEYDHLKDIGLSEYQAEERIFVNHAHEANKLRAPFALLMEHIEYIIHLVGVDHVGIGADYDGMPSPPLQLDDVTTYPLITKALVEKGYSETDILKILGGNALRVLKANEA